MQRKNILFISADQFRGDCLSILQQQAVQTPHLDQLAQDGLLFSKHYSQAAPCGPARASLLTGRYSMNHRSILNGTPLSDSYTNIARELRKVGYDPIVFGYTDTSTDPRTIESKNDPLLRDYGGVLPGFRIGFKYDQEVCKPWIAHLMKSGVPIPERLLDTYLPCDDSGTIRNQKGESTRLPTRYSKEHSDSAFLVDQVLDYIYTTEEAWCIHAVFFKPHPPFFAPEPYNTMYVPDEMQSPNKAESWQQEASIHPFLDYWMQRQRRPGYLMGHAMNVVEQSDQSVAHMKSAYFGLISEVDAQIGRLIAALKSKGLYESTCIIFTSDHAEQLGDHWLWGKGGYFDESYHIPCIIRIPDAPIKGHIERAFTQSIDIMPTVLEWLDLPIPETCDGHSLMPFLKGNTPVYWRDFVWWEYNFYDPIGRAVEEVLRIQPADSCLTVLRSTSFKYVFFPTLPVLLFDLEKDPGCFVNCAPDPAYAGIRMLYAEKMLSHRTRYMERSLSQFYIHEEGISKLKMRPDSPKIE